VRNNWSAPTDPETVARRAAGRRHFNAVRRFQRAYRRMQVARLLLKYGQDGLRAHGLRARIARELGVSRGTITRDVQALIERSRLRCPLCSSEVLPASPDQAAEELSLWADLTNADRQPPI
jgi:hypothetical protein